MLFQLSYMNILSIIGKDTDGVKVFFFVAYALLALYFLVKGNIFVFERRDEKKLYEATLKDKNLLNRTVVLLMCKLLQSDKQEMYANKLAFVINYIRTSFDKNTDELIDKLVFRHTTSHSVYLNEKVYIYIKKIRRAFINPQGWLRDLKRSKDYSVYGEIHNRNGYFSLPDEHVNEIALSLVDYLNEEQKKYLSYLLFQLAYMDGNINKGEETDLKRICVNHFLTTEEFYTLKDSFESKSEDKWFYRNLKEKNPELYSDPEAVFNIFPQNTETHTDTNTKFIIKNSTSNTEFTLIFLSFQALMSIVELIALKTNGIAIFLSICIVILFITAFHYYNKPISDTYNVAITRKEYSYFVKGYFYADLLYLISVIYVFFA